MDLLRFLGLTERPALAPVLQIIMQAFLEAGVSRSRVKSCFPSNFSIWVDPGSVDVSRASLHARLGLAPPAADNTHPVDPRHPVVVGLHGCGASVCRCFVVFLCCFERNVLTRITIFPLLPFRPNFMAGSVMDTAIDSLC